jgi:RsiW-degrading membrane proteinase PrsW (M82 family)
VPSKKKKERKGKELTTVKVLIRLLVWGFLLLLLAILRIKLRASCLLAGTGPLEPHFQSRLFVLFIFFVLFY